VVHEAWRTFLDPEKRASYTKQTVDVYVLTLHLRAFRNPASTGAATVGTAGTFVFEIDVIFSGAIQTGNPLTYTMAIGALGKLSPQ